MKVTRADWLLVDSLALVAEQAPAVMRAGHLAPKARALLGRIERDGAESYAAMKARGLAEMQRLFGDEWSEDDTERYYVIFQRLSRLGLLPEEGPPAAVARIGAEAEEEAELEAHSHLVDP